MPRCLLWKRVPAARVHHSYGSYAPSTYGSYGPRKANPITVKRPSAPTERPSANRLATKSKGRVNAPGRLGETGPLSQGVQARRKALRTPHINGMEARKKRPRAGSRKRPRGFK